METSQNGMDMSAIAAQYAQQSQKPITTKKVAFNPSNYLNTRLEPGQNSRVARIRLLSVEPNGNTPFIFLKAHNIRVHPELSKTAKHFKSFICTENANVEGITYEQCPICQAHRDFMQKKNQSTNEAEKKVYGDKAFEYMAKDVIICRVIDRDHEADGPKFWKINASSKKDGVYDQIMTLFNTRNQESLAVNGQPYNIFDYNYGKDLNITFQRQPKKPDNIIVSSVVDSGIQTPLSCDPNQANAWISDPKTWRDVYSIKPAPYLQIVLDGGYPVFNKECGQFVAREFQKKDEQTAIAQQQDVTGVLSYNGMVQYAQQYNQQQNAMQQMQSPMPQPYMQQQYTQQQYQQPNPGQPYQPNQPMQQ